MTLTPQLISEYATLYASCQILPERAGEAMSAAARIQAHWERYANVAAVVRPGIPWKFVGLVHLMEGGQRWDRHLANGDPLTARTVHVPIGRPPLGNPPFTWEQGAVDALRLMGIDDVRDWTPEGILYQLERWNGFGYRKHGIPTPYLWAGSNHYSCGKFTSDGRFDQLAVSRQCGAALILRALESGATNQPSQT